jgi:5'-nucleotidase
MTGRGLDLTRARILIVNDDGIYARGIRVLEQAMRKAAREVWVVAPEDEQSAASHSLTLRRPLRVRKLRGRRYAVNGTPTDCVLLAISEIMKNRRPDIVLSGVNRGGNMGEDVTYSGTVAAAMEATLLGFPAIALSQVYDDRHLVKWATAEHWAPEVVRRLVAKRWPSNVLINVNFPNVLARSVAGVEIVRQGRRKIGGDLVHGIDPRGEPFFWIGGQREEDRFLAGTDLEAVNRGAIAVTPLTLDLTHGPTLKTLRTAVE